MAQSNITVYESSAQNGQPIECYKFRYRDMTYLYTSDRSDVALTVTENELTGTERYAADYIRRNSIKPSSQGDSSSVVVTVTKDNAVAALFKAAPPDKPVTLTIIRLHDQDHGVFDKLFAGEIVQASFRDSECELTVKMENWLSRKLPNFMRQFFCCNVVYDASCRLNKADYEQTLYVDGASGLNVAMNELTNYETDYFAGGMMYYGGNMRMISANAGAALTLRYPFPATPMGYVTLVPGCDKLFRTCAKRFNNTLNFTGCPYIPPDTDSAAQVGNGVYWVDSAVVKRDTDGYIGRISM
ncbi:phage BR0599 family protein [Acetonema longum]|uniref:Phage gene transfer protein n=1 Tax=Acetonema longum DSM 6540 TaxID=1009370 RepID=F7NEB0_9FIRM|nr:phage BR0599 family protein [Acetonema longum]EGO65622.1 Phage gene transfer protein [Acetonema longum DSM 6540]